MHYVHRLRTTAGLACNTQVVAAHMHAWEEDLLSIGTAVQSSRLVPPSPSCYLLSCPCTSALVAATTRCRTHQVELRVPCQLDFQNLHLIESILPLEVLKLLFL